MNLYFTLASYAVATALGYGGAWKWQAANITQMELEHAHESLTHQADAIAHTESRIAQVATAQDHKATRDTGNRHAAAGAAAAGSGLRLASADTVRAAQADSATCTQSVAIYDAILNTMVEVGGRIAREADQWESTAIAQHEAAK